jgi:hypothetical protein
MKTHYLHAALGFRLLLISALILFLCNPGFSQDNGKGLTPLQVSKIKHVDDAIISPDGKTIAYTVTQPADPREEKKPAVNHLYVRGENDSTGTAYISSMDVSHIAFRPGQRTITFLAEKESDEVNALYEIGLQGGEARKLLSYPRSIAGYSWARDGNHVAFMVADAKKEINNELPYKPEIYEENMPQRRGYVTNAAKENRVIRAIFFILILFLIRLFFSIRLSKDFMLLEISLDCLIIFMIEFPSSSTPSKSMVILLSVTGFRLV